LRERERERVSFLTKERELEFEHLCAGGGRFHATLLPELVLLTFLRPEWFLALTGANQWRLNVSQPLGLWSFVFP
jgi:hypothetical protein